MTQTVSLRALLWLGGILYLLGCAPKSSSPSESIDATSSSSSVQLGPRPFFLADQLKDGPLRESLQSCAGPFESDRFSIGHRGAPLQFPEHTEESYRAAARMGAGVLECDVTFTSDLQLVCRHSQCDLHTTTDILSRPKLAAKCQSPFEPANLESGTPAKAKCCTSDITLEDFKSLCGKMDAFNPMATTVQEYLDGTPPWRTDLYSICGTVLSHQESIALFQELDVAMTPELKAPMVEMPFEGHYTQAHYASALIDELKSAGVRPADALPQSFNPEDLAHWIATSPDYGAQAILLDGRDPRTGFDPHDPQTWSPSMEEIQQSGVRTIAPPIWMLAHASNGVFEPTPYGLAARAAGLDLIAWTVERSGKPSQTPDWYFNGMADAMHSEGDVFTLLEMLDKRLEVRGVFSDWPATTTFYANCRE